MAGETQTKHQIQTVARSFSKSSSTSSSNTRLMVSSYTGPHHIFEAGEYNTDVLYRDQLRENVLVKQYYLDVDIAHLISFTEETAHKLNTEPAEIIPLVCLKTYSNTYNYCANNIFSSKRLSRNAHSALFTLPKRINNSLNINSSSTPPFLTSLFAISQPIMSQVL
jgi:hypothetical protein